MWYFRISLCLGVTIRQFHSVHLAKESTVDSSVIFQRHIRYSCINSLLCPRDENVWILAEDVVLGKVLT